VSVGTLTSNEGSAISSPRFITRSKAVSHSFPKWMLWCSTPLGKTPRMPTCETTHEGE
jgi:hypothetical protein